jgi:hypothetical protein
MLHGLPAEVLRLLIVGSLFFLPYRRRKAVDRWWRGREEYHKLHDADWLLVSWGKSGRTWLRVMLSRFYQLRFGLKENRLLGFDNLHRIDPDIPSVFFTHGNYLRDFTKHGYDTKVDFLGKKIVLLVRDPRDVAVSQFFQWKYRMRPGKKLLNDYPPHGADVSIHEFVMDPDAGLPKIIDYFNGWLSWVAKLGDVLIVRYEDMRIDPATTLRRILEFTGTPGTDAQVKDAVDFAAYENLKKMEEQKSFSLLRAGWRLVPGDRKNPDSFKVRRAKVGGYRDYFSQEEVSELDAMVNQGLLPGLGYTKAEQETGQGIGQIETAYISES